MKKEMNNKGFSLAELIIVIAIMAVLVGVLAPQFLKYVESSRVQKDVSAMSEVENAVKIACSVESVYNALPTGATEVSIADGTTVSCAVTELQNEILLTIPDAIDFTSKQYDGSTQTVTVTIDSTAGTVNVTNSWTTATTTP